MMLALDEFTIGSLTDAKPLSLVLPRSVYDNTVLVGGTVDQPAYVCLAGEGAYSLIGRNEAHACCGLIVTAVKIEVDPKKVVSHRDRTAGGLIREGTTLAIVSTGIRGFSLRTVPLIEGLADVPLSEAAVFLGWQIVLGEGLAKRVLWSPPAVA
ncbi:hypothetical protein [Ancylobacter sp. FA202]|uniref:hypothetical protein n=1 Tax=Ancylobacter sp. FA202 TaxID=1111106 RepID=UPI00037A6A6E|nr:hypothetical protein [Ancylobacter sp. FA202]